MELNHDIEKMAKLFIAEELPKYLGKKVYACDLGRYIFNQEWEDIQMSEKDARDFIVYNWDQSGEYLQNAKEEYGELCGNPFTFPLTFALSMINEACEEIVSMTGFAKEHWDDDAMVLTQEMIDEIIKDMNEYNWEGFA